MTTDRPPPYFPQGSLSPPDPERWRRTKLTLIGCGMLAMLGLAGGIALLVYLLR